MGNKTCKDCTLEPPKLNIFVTRIKHLGQESTGLTVSRQSQKQSMTGENDSEKSH